MYNPFVANINLKKKRHVATRVSGRLVYGIRIIIPELDARLFFPVFA